MTSKANVALCALFGAALVYGLFWWHGGDGNRAAPLAPAAVEGSSPAVVAAASPPSIPAIRHPVPAAATRSSDATPDVAATLAGLFGDAAVASLFRTDDFAHRFVATVDNLGRGSAPAGVWPMNPAKGRFETTDAGAGEVVQPDNGLRYVPEVLLLEQLDIKQAVRAYERHYPALQHEYEELGFPHGYFNDRFVDVLDLLLATPEAVPPVHVHRPAINGVQPARPWLLYEFDDPTLQALSAGQRILLRMGPIDERRVKVRLAELRRRLVADSAEPGR